MSTNKKVPIDPLDREYAPGWRPAEGEIVRGTVVGIHRQLAGKLAAIEPKVGDVIGVKYVGEPLGSARAKRYRVDRTADGGGEPSAEVNWSDYRFADADAPTSVHAPLDYEAEAATVAAEEAEQNAVDAAAEEVPF